MFIGGGGPEVREKYAQQTVTGADIRRDTHVDWDGVRACFDEDPMSGADGVKTNQLGPAGSAPTGIEASQPRVSIRTDGTQRVLEAELVVANPQPGVILDAQKLLAGYMQGGNKVDRATLIVRLTGLEEGKAYKGVSFRDLGSGQLEGINVEIFADRVPKGAELVDLHFDTNRTALQLGQIKLGGHIELVQGKLVHVGFETFYG